MTCVRLHLFSMAVIIVGVIAWYAVHALGVWMP